MHFVNALKEYLGWCPNGHRMAPVRKHTPWDGFEFNPLPTEDTFMNDGILIDYGRTGISMPVFIGLVAGAICIVVIFSLILPFATYRVASGILMCGLLLPVVLVILARDLRGARLEITRDTLVIRRPLSWPVVIQKEEIESVEIRDYRPPMPTWLQGILFLFLIPVSTIYILSNVYMQFVSGEIASSSFITSLGFYLCIVLLFLVSYYRFRIRSRYPHYLFITTGTRKVAAIYTKNPEEMAGMLLRSV
ncbi:MAG: hypothetical protein WC502_04640 [Methanolinea sp.]|jgi:hypothetical protein